MIRPLLAAEQYKQEHAGKIPTIKLLKCMQFSYDSLYVGTNNMTGNISLLPVPKVKP